MFINVPSCTETTTRKYEETRGRKVDGAQEGRKRTKENDGRKKQQQRQLSATNPPHEGKIKLTFVAFYIVHPLARRGRKKRGEPLLLSFSLSTTLSLLLPPFAR